MHPEIDRFAHLDSLVHRWDPRWKLACLFLLMLSMGLERPGSRDHPSWEADLPPALGCLGFSVAIVLLARLPFALILTRLRGVAWFFAVVLVTFPLTVPINRILVVFRVVCISIEIRFIFIFVCKIKMRYHTSSQLGKIALFVNCRSQIVAIHTYFFFQPWAP